VKRLDIAAMIRGDSSTDLVHVIPLANANVDDVANTLAGLGAGVSRSSSSSSSAPGAAGRPPTPSAPSSSTTPGGQRSPLFEGDVRIAADKTTNSIVAVATGRDFFTLRDLIQKLDITRRQVFIEAVILEVTVNKDSTLGVAWHGGGGAPGNSLLFGGSEPSSSVNSILFSPTSLSGLSAALRGPSIPNADQILGLPAGTSVPAFGVFVQFLQNNGDVNVVSMPHILTTDNEKASIEVGQTLPFPGAPIVAGFGAVGGAAGTSAPIAGAPQRQPVSLKLEVTPHVNDGDFVRLEIDNTIEDVTNPNYNGLGPATSKRAVKTTITVRDQQTIVIGGLIKDSVSETVQKVPLLGDIPILGYLFKSTTKSITKQNLIIILTPYIIKDQSDMRRIFERKMRERREFMERSSVFKDERDYEAQVDYRRKRGLLEEINRAAVAYEQEARELLDAERAMHQRDLEGPIDLPYTPPPPPPLFRPSPNFRRQAPPPQESPPPEQAPTPAPDPGNQ
jgi:general secretion pathway protein D